MTYHMADYKGKRYLAKDGKIISSYKINDMTHEDKIIEELATKYGKSYTIKSKPYDYIHEGLNNTEFLSHFKSDLKKALTTYRNQVLEEVEQILTTHEEHDKSRDECEADGLYCRSGCVYDAVKRIERLKHPTN